MGMEAALEGAWKETTLKTSGNTRTLGCQSQFLAEERKTCLMELRMLLEVADVRTS
jgi:hypothetical protein